MTRSPFPRRFSPLQDVWFPSALLREGVLANYLEFAEVLRTREFSADEWEKYRTKRLREVLARVTADAPFYQSRLGALNVERMTLDGLARLPLTTGADLAHYGKAALVRPFASGGVCYLAGSSEDGPIAAPSSWLEQLASSLNLAANLADCMTRHVLPHDPVAAVLFCPESDCLADSYCDALRNLSVAHVRDWPGPSEHALARTHRLLLDAGANVIIAGAPTLSALAAYDRSRGRPLCTSGQVDLLLVAGAAPSAALLRQLGLAFGEVPCFALAYGAPETLVVASSCGMGHKHLAMQNYVAEVLDLATGQPVVAGAPGELALTSLLCGIRPLIRYRTGDVVSLRASDCACGNKADVLENFGRAADAVFLNGRRWFAKEIEHIVVGALGLTHGFRLSVTKHDARDVLLIELDRPFAGALHVTEAVLSAQIGGTVRCGQRSVPERSAPPPRRMSDAIFCIDDRR